MTNGDLAGKGSLTAKGSRSAISPARMHLVAEAGSDAAWLFESSLRAGARPQMVNALSVAFAVVSGPDAGEYTFARYADMPLGARSPTVAEDTAQSLLDYYLHLHNLVRLSPGFGTVRVHKHVAFPLGARAAPTAADLARFRLSPPFPVQFTRFSCGIACGLAAVINCVSLSHRPCAEWLVDLAQQGEPFLQGMTRLQQCGSRFQQLARRVGAAWAAVHIVRVVPKALRATHQGAARLDWIVLNDSGPLAVSLLDSDRDVYHAVSIIRDPFGRRVILDHEAPEALPFSKEALDLCVASRRTVVGLEEVMLVTTRKQAAQAAVSAWGAV